MKHHQKNQRRLRGDRSLLPVLIILILFTCSRQEERLKPPLKPERTGIEQVYTRVYKFLGYKEYEVAFDELERVLPLYGEEDLKRLDLQNLFAKYIIEGEDTLENIIRNYNRFFRYFKSSDAEGIYQVIMYRASISQELERLPLIAESQAGKVKSPAGIYFILTRTYFGFRQRDKTNEYLDCLITLAPDHPATSRLIFDMRGKKLEYRSQSVNSLRDIFYNDSIYSNLETVALNFHIPSMMNREWRDIGWSLLKSRDYRLRQIAYSEIPIFFAREGDSDALYELLREAIREGDYTLFRLAARSLLYVHPEPQSVVGRIKNEFSDHPYIFTLYAKHLMNLSANNLKEATEWYIKALERENNIEIFFEAVDLFRRTSEFFKLKAFAEELLFMYPYDGELYKIYSEMCGGNIDSDRLMRYFEQLPISVDRYALFSHLLTNLADRERILLDGLKVFQSDCTLVIQLLNLYQDCQFGRFPEIYRQRLKGIISQGDIDRCLTYLKGEERERIASMIKNGKREGCDAGK
jgi:tetratricopeptide (TPR) repeat protein